MEMYKFQKAAGAWSEGFDHEFNQFAGFYTEISLKKAQRIHIAVAAKSYYRLFINGEFLAHGPARTASGYARVDELVVNAEGKVQLAFEVAAYSMPGRYCNDNTMEPGMLTVEVTDEDGNLLSATGGKGWLCRPLECREWNCETMSHCRGILELYRLDPHSYDWVLGETAGMKPPILVENEPTYLVRRAPYASMKHISMRPASVICDVVPGDESGTDFGKMLSEMFNHGWNENIPEENRFVWRLECEKESTFSGKITREGNVLSIKPGAHPAAVLYTLSESECGFIKCRIHVSEEAVVDLVNSDHRSVTGAVKGNRFVCRYILQPGEYELLTFEPKLVRNVKVIVRTQGTFRLEVPEVIDDTYPDDQAVYFECNDNEWNRIYEGARRTLRLNTLDIFMDCPERERGGWLCDSQFTARAAFQLFGNLSVEKDFIENFMLTDPDVMWKGFFPEVYPASTAKPGFEGIMNWSFYLMTELYAYYHRSADREFIDECRERVARFVEGLLSLRGESGLIETDQVLFVDASQSNMDVCLRPISIPVNCLAVKVLEELAELYNESKWREQAASLREIIDRAEVKAVNFMTDTGDSASFENGQLKRGKIQTEAGTALELWSSFHRENSHYINDFVHRMGPASKYRANPKVGKTNAFIGMMLRFEVLEMLGKTETLAKDLKSLYLEELRYGSGTFFESIDEFSGCHGFAGNVGAILTESIYGLGQPDQVKKEVVISPYVRELRWVSGTAMTKDGMIYYSWHANPDTYRLEISLILPEGWKPVYRFSRELSGWDIYVNNFKWHSSQEKTLGTT